MPLVKWETTKVEKTLKTARTEGADGKMHTKRTQVQEVPYTFPAVNPLEINSIDELSRGLAEILESKTHGFLTLRALVEHINYGLYNNTRQVIARGADVRYTAAQRNAIKMFGTMAKEGMLDRQAAVEGLLRQGVQDAEAAIDSWMTSETSGEAATASSNGVSA